MSDNGATAVGLLRELLRIDTQNPPGGETEAQELLASKLGDAGWSCELLEAEPGRPNLVARLSGEEPGRTLCLLGHVDTVPADPGDWTRDPWSGDLEDGLVWGRGAQDMKTQVAAEAAACIELAASGWRPPSGELLLVITADEETGAHLGAQWLCSEHPEKVRADLVVNEGGGMSFEWRGRRLYTLCIGEKGVFRFNLTAHGRAGHASVPALGENALLRLAPHLVKLERQPGPEPNPEGLAFLGALLGSEIAASTGAVAEALEAVRAADPLVAAFLGVPMLSVTLVPTKASASAKSNVIPARAEVLVDCRVPPGMGEAEVRGRVAEVLGPEIASGGSDSDAVGIEFVESVTGNASAPGGDLYDAIADWVDAADPGAGILPIVMPGFSDSHWFRKAFGSAVVYGFCPQRDMTMLEASPLIHGADERILASDVDLAFSFFRDLPRRILGD